MPRKTWTAVAPEPVQAQTGMAVTLNSDLAERVARAADARGRSLDNLVEYVLEEYLRSH